MSDAATIPSASYFARMSPPALREEVQRLEAIALEPAERTSESDLEDMTHPTLAIHARDLARVVAAIEAREMGTPPPRTVAPITEVNARALIGYFRDMQVATDAALMKAPYELARPAITELQSFGEELATVLMGGEVIDQCVTCEALIFEGEEGAAIGEDAALCPACVRLEAAETGGDETEDESDV